MEELRDKDGYIILDKLPFVMIDIKHFVFYDNDIKYYFKSNNNVYNELISEELAKDYGISYVHYDLASYKGQHGVISEDFIKDNKYISINQVIYNYYEKKGIRNNHNNLMDIWSALDFRYRNTKLSNELMDNIVNIFLFDILIANGDRNHYNYGILENESEVKVAPLFDNECILSSLGLDERMYLLGVDEDDNFLDDNFTGPEGKFLIKFLKQSSTEYTDLLESKLWIISEENIDKVLNRIEERINAKINKSIKEEIKFKFGVNYKYIKDTIEFEKERKHM